MACSRLGPRGRASLTSESTVQRCRQVIESQRPAPVLDTGQAGYDRGGSFSVNGRIAGTVIFFHGDIDTNSDTWYT